ncbi:T9SS type A sorting domain-containing protein [Hymenobacter sp. BRD67]|uniref:T9SS type A sorting domain-containing protein n=1 Tax=Hymenobacter sp. BRD67 TaxID=2675877 RepID=UPI00156690B7|nr:T9SS type A sorting domain-containing protein [Hymenobacter sp. BRD67]QKG51435.1 T9SS type A sorting domain-containing protein [Hymenobacter sp. BRD67]
MKKFATLATLAALTAASLSAQAQITVDGTLSPAEVGTGAGQYQLLGSYTATTNHSVADRGLKALYMATNATTLNVMVVCSPEQTSYSHVLLYLGVPNKPGIAAGTALPGVSGNTPLTQQPTLDMPTTNYVFRVTVSPFSDQPGAIYLSRADYTIATPAEVGMGSTKKDGSVTSDSHDAANAQSAFRTSATGSVAANTTTGWEFSIPLASIGGAAAGSNFNVMVGYIRDSDKGFYSDVLPQIAGQTTDLGLNPNFLTIPGKQYYTYQVGTGLLASRTAASALPVSIYPNPLAADSRLAYTVADATQPVTVEAFNSLGQRAATLLQTTQTAGEHSLSLAPLQGLAAGVYLVRVLAGSQLTSQRVTVK